jgi:hypothetical protein
MLPQLKSQYIAQSVHGGHPWGHYSGLCEHALLLDRNVQQDVNTCAWHFAMRSMSFS